ncbi:ABC-2 type transport system ATP-binding protein [Parabacteroides sp. PFB2-12]|nr:MULTISPECIES: ABC transporter ATP-binding protein [unclassified Parabacteroides]MDH6343277.1 ABC-2 type transport system ATP-binding protein [Parabacteroides sp. PM6-13]MDH6390293.1 ABC-2 type transport system ATP-binding protein [Parabacteroides sp. PFB2-12]
MKAVVVDNIHKSYEGGIRALSGISFDADRGELFGIIGPDGAGKTTLFRIMATLLLANEGTCRIDGLDVVDDYREIRKRVGYMPGRFSLYQDLTVEENLGFFASVFRTTIAENYHLVEDIYKQLEPFKRRRAGKLSGGMKQKLALCCALIHKPSVLFLDEPTTGVDPVSRKEFWEMLNRLQKQGITIIVSTPYMDEAKLCDRIALIKNGQFMSINRPMDIIRQFDLPLYAVKGDDMFRLLHDVREYKGVDHCYVSGEFHHFTVADGGFDSSALLAQLQQKGHSAVRIERVEANIEDCYMRLAKD